MQGLRTNSTLFLGPREGRGEAANSDFGPALGVEDPQECRGYVPIPPFFWAPGKAGVRQPILILARAWR